MKTDVRFESAGLSLAGHLYRPAGEIDVPLPAIVVGHPGSGVKEQAAGLYAHHLAENGFVALAFDAAHQGDSEGEPRGLENPSQRVEDMKAAVSFLSTRSDVAADRIGLLGICASGAYSLSAAATDHRARAVATVSCADISRQFRYGADGSQPSTVLQQMLATAAAARTDEARGQPPATFSIFPATEEEARNAGRHVFEGWQYYCTPRAAHPRSAKSFTWNSVDRIATFDCFAAIDLIAPRPLLMIVGREAVTSWMTVEAFHSANEPKELVWVDGASHVDLYDREEFVTPVIARLADFFGSNLGTPDRDDL